jgi:phosphoribosylformylglycinamidine synthase PurS subunit
VRFSVLVEVRLHDGIADPQGATIERALPALGFAGVEGVRVGKAIRFALEAPDEQAARRQVQAMTERLLANPVIEEAEVQVLGPVSAGAGGGAR